MSLTPGFQLGPYKILSPVGKGGMGEVYRAKDTRLEREVAIKVLPEYLAINPDALRRFEREGKALAALSHPNILTIFDVGTDQGVSFVVMELLEGETLRARIGHSALPWEKVLEIAVPVAEGLSAAHSKGIVHRDLKPENVILTSDGRIKILDFGLARHAHLFSQQELTEAPTKSRELESVTVSGTIPYMSPEQVSGKSVDARSDIFSFGCVLYEMLTGNRAFSGDSAAETIAAILKESPVSLLKSTKQIPPALQQVVTHCLEKSPEQRFQSARDLVFALKSVSHESGITKAAPLLSAHRPLLRLGVWITAALVLLLATGISVYLFTTPDKAIDSLAILPFINTGANPDTEYLSDGITDTLINNLSQIPKLRVMARGTVFSYKGQEVDPRKVGHDLKVNAVVTGSILQQGDALLIRADLVNVADGVQLWGEQYKRKFADIVAVQEEISKEIANKLRLKLTGEEKKRLTKHYTENTEAYQLYLKGRYHFYKFSEEGLTKSIPYFQQAIAKDPSYALAYSGLAGTYFVLGVNYWPPADAFPKAKEAARKAAELDDSIGIVHNMLGVARLFYDWDWEGARREFERAAELNPSLPDPHNLLAYYWLVTGNTGQGIQELKIALELEPYGLIFNGDLAFALALSGKYDESIRQSQTTLEIDPQYSYGYLGMGMAYVEKGMYADAIAAIEKAKSFEQNAEILGRLGNAYARAGERTKALEVLNEFNSLSSKKYMAPYGPAMIYCGLGQNEKALEWLEKAYRERTPWLIWIGVDPVFAPLHKEPRFQQILTKMNLPS